MRIERVHAGQAFLGGLHFWPADVGGGKRDLPLEIGEVDDVEIHDPKPAHACRGEIKPQRRAQTAGADHQHFGLGELELTLHAHFRHDQVAAVALNLFFRKRALGFGSQGRARNDRHNANSLYVLRSSSPRPPAIEGTILMVSPSLMGVFSFCR